MKRLEGKVALITGGTSGIGLATAKRFMEEGAYVYVTGRRQKELDEAAKVLGTNGIGVQGDISKLADLDHLYAKIKQEKGRLDILFANAGAFEFLPIAMVSEAHFDKQFNINVRGTVFTVQKSLSLLSDGASVILNASIAGLKGMDAASVYSATKAAVRSLARTLASDLKARKIRVNAISPGPVLTPGFDTLGMTKEQIQGFLDHMASQIPLGRTGQPEEIANAVLFLASSESSFVNGIDLVADGGLSQV
ncbi:MAG TPA: SDR family oxidoreductase [bacterium]|jgi:NAD(P)-dependent dehydrogenase (short-subunit alcohol dehydrogenase family)|nr:SDR family oxidoreductase [bacterium]